MEAKRFTTRSKMCKRCNEMYFRTRLHSKICPKCRKPPGPEAGAKRTFPFDQMPESS